MARADQERAEAEAPQASTDQVAPMIRPLPAHHRDSDASDASNSHLMVYDDSQERKSSISFDKIRQISLTYSLQSEDESSILGFGVNSSSEQFLENTSAPNALQVADQTQDLKAPSSRDTSGDSMRALEEQLRQVRERIEMTNEPAGRNPFLEPAGSGAASDFVPREQQVYYAAAANQQQRQRARASEAAKDNNDFSAAGNQDNSSTVSLKLSRNMSANIIINNETPGSRRGSHSEPRAAKNCNTGADDNNNYCDRYGPPAECQSGAEYLEQSNSDHSSSCWDWRAGGLAEGSSRPALAPDCGALAPRSRPPSGQLKTDYAPEQTNGRRAAVAEAAAAAAKQEALIKRSDEWMQLAAERQQRRHHQTRDPNSRPTSAGAGNQEDRSRAAGGGESRVADAFGLDSAAGWLPDRACPSPASDQRAALEVGRGLAAEPLDCSARTTKRAANGGRQHDVWPDNGAHLQTSAHQAARGAHFGARPSRPAANHLASASPPLRSDGCLLQQQHQHQRQRQLFSAKRAAPMMRRTNLGAADQLQGRPASQTNSSQLRPRGHFAGAQFASQRYIEQQRRLRRQMLEAQNQSERVRSNLPNFIDVGRSAAVPEAGAVRIPLRGLALDGHPLSPSRRPGAAYRVDTRPNQLLAGFSQIGGQRRRHHHFSLGHLPTASASLQSSPQMLTRQFYSPDIQLGSRTQVDMRRRELASRRTHSNSWQELDRSDFDDYDERASELELAYEDEFARAYEWPDRSNNRLPECCLRDLHRAAAQKRWPTSYGGELVCASSGLGRPELEPNEFEFQLEGPRGGPDEEAEDEQEADGDEELEEDEPEADEYGDPQWFYSSENGPPPGRRRTAQPQTTRAQTRRHQQPARAPPDAKMMPADSAALSISSSGGEPADSLVFHDGRRWERRPTGPFVAAGGQSGQEWARGQPAGDSRRATGGAGSIAAAAAAASPPPPPSVVIDSNVNNLNPSRPFTGEPGETVARQPEAVAPSEPLAPGQPVKQQAQKPVDIRNLLNNETTTDRLHIEYQNNNKSHGCTESRCLGAMINPKPVPQRVRSGAETWEQAKEFIDGYYKSIKRFDTAAHKNRLLEIEQQIKSTDTYYLRETELIYGAKLAWRNAPRCIGRIQWSKLQVFDARFTRSASEMFEAICNHIKYATNKGMLRSAATIFPQRVKSLNNDWRVWNAQLISYAGYRNEQTGACLGDPINADFTQVCFRLGWKGPRGGQQGMFDVLPIVLSANGGPPQLFELPDELVMRVKLKHPKLEWFEQLGLEWYALPAVSSMMLDVGGLQFTACPFSGWYMVTEIGTRDLADVSRYNMLERIARAMGLNTETNSSLWRDQALTQLNLAVLDSFQSANVTIVDHHTASETFMTHLQNEQRLRGGCPADWVWLVPPTAGSTTQVFHQEMVNYHLLPNYEYLPHAWKNYDWSAWERMKELEEEKKKLKSEGEQVAGKALSPGKKNAESQVSSLLSSLKSVAALQSGGTVRSPLAKLSLNASPLASNGDLTPRHLRFKEIARAVKFTSKLFGKALSRRIKATILYATETGKSERFANKLAQIFSHAFNVHLMSMSDYDMTCLEHEALLLIVTSTFGNGDPPENGELFAKHLAAIKITGDSSPDIDSINSVATNPFFQMLSEDHKDGLSQAANAAAAAAAEGKSSSSSGCGTAEFDSPTREQLDSGDDSSTDQPVADSETNKRAWLSSSHQREQLATNVASAAADGQRRPAPATQNFLNQEQQTNIKPLSNVRYAVFALGSTAYPHFCAFGRYVDQTLGELGAERILKCQCGDELCGQEKAFNEWSKQVFEVACDVFCQTDQMQPIDDRSEPIWTPDDVKFVYLDDDNNSSASLASKSTIIQNLVGIVGKKILPFSVKRRRNLHEFTPEENLQTICVDLDGGNLRPIKFEPGDHISIYPVNKLEVVDKIIARIEHDLATLKLGNGELDTNGFPASDESSKLSSPRKCIKLQQLDLHMDKRVSVQVRRGNMDPLTQADEWIQCDTLPITSIREALTRYLDITNAPNQDFLSILARQASEPDERKRLQQMSRNFTIYEEWKNKQVPSLLGVLEEFKSVKFHPALITQIPPMKPRFYSVSGTSMSLTLGVVRFTTQMGQLREGLCSNYLNSVPVDPKSYVYGYVRSAPAFHMPQDKTIPMLLISAGTGIAPFRAFWLQRYADMFTTTDQAGSKPVDRSTFGRIEMYFGCRNSKYILYKDELDEMHEIDVLSSINVAFSRPRDCDVFEGGEQRSSSNSDAFSTDRANKSKIDSIRQARKRMYVQDKLFERGSDVFKLIMYEGAHIYVCGDVAMADGVYKTLTKILNQQIKAGRQALKKARSSATICDLSPEAGKSSCQELVRNGEDGESILMNLRNLNRYHEDIFGAKQA